MKQCHRCYRTYENSADRCTVCGNQLVLLPENAGSPGTFAGNYAANDVRSRLVNTIDLNSAASIHAARAASQAHQPQRNQRPDTAQTERVPETPVQAVQNSTVRRRTGTFASNIAAVETPVQEHAAGNASAPTQPRTQTMPSGETGQAPRTPRQIRPDAGRMQEERPAGEANALPTPLQNAEPQSSSFFRRDPERAQMQPRGTFRQRGRRGARISLQAVSDMLLRYILPIISIVTAVVFVVMNWSTIASVLSSFALFWVIGFCIMLFLSRGFGGVETLMVGSTVIAVIGMLLYYNIANISGGLYCLIMGLMPSVIILAAIFYLLRSILRP